MDSPPSSFLDQLCFQILLLNECRWTYRPIYCMCHMRETHLQTESQAQTERALLFPMKLPTPAYSGCPGTFTAFSDHRRRGRTLGAFPSPPPTVNEIEVPRTHPKRFLKVWLKLPNRYFQQPGQRFWNWWSWTTCKKQCQCAFPAVIKHEGEGAQGAQC